MGKTTQYGRQPTALVPWLGWMGICHCDGNQAITRIHDVQRLREHGRSLQPQVAHMVTGDFL